MQLALRKDPPAKARWWQRFSCWVIKARLVSDYCHAGVVIDGHLYHATSGRGLHCLAPSQWSPERWDLINIAADEAAALYEFRRLSGAKYDWVSLLSFVGLRVRDSSRMYCFEWCWIAITGEVPRRRITPEAILRKAYA